MHIDAIDDNSPREFITPLGLKQGRVRVELPDDLILPKDEVGQLSPDQLSPEVIARAHAVREALDAIRLVPPPPDDELPALADKQRQRLDEAFALREDR
jgi:hypothetical protein